MQWPARVPAGPQEAGRTGRHRPAGHGQPSGGEAGQPAARQRGPWLPWTQSGGPRGQERGRWQAGCRPTEARCRGGVQRRGLKILLSKLFLFAQ